MLYQRRQQSGDMKHARASAERAIGLIQQTGARLLEAQAFYTLALIESAENNIPAAFVASSKAVDALNTNPQHLNAPTIWRAHAKILETSGQIELAQEFLQRAQKRLQQIIATLPEQSQRNALVDRDSFLNI
jgi:tetratricopeptide (TPR) repeat protein